MAGKERKKIKFEYSRLETYRSYHVDGIVGGITPKGKIYADFFLEKFPSPTRVEHEVNEEGTLGKETDRTLVSGITRQIESGIIMDIDIAVAFHRWLGERIEEYHQASKKVEEAS